MTAPRTGSGSESPGVSVFLPTAFRFRDGHLRRAIDSVLGQTYTAWELLAVDDGSSDGTSGFLADLAARDARVRHVRLERNIGLPAFTLSLAWKLARAPRFAWLFDDCEYLPDHLAILAGALDVDASAGMVYGRARAMLADAERFIIGAPFDLALAETGHNSIPNVCVMVRREVIDAVGWYDPHVVMKRVCDWDLWLRIARKFSIKYLDRVLADEHGTSLPFSLGRMCALDMNLALDYARTQRSSRLQPASMVEEDCYRFDLGFPLSAQQAESLDLQLFEHALLTTNESLAQKAGVHFAAMVRRDGAGATGGVADKSHAVATTAARLLRTRVASFAEREIELDSALNAALTAADSRTVEIDRLNAQLAAAQAGVAEFRDAADSRFSRIQGLEAQQAGVIAEMQRQCDAAHAAAQAFRKAADERLAAMELLQRQLDARDAGLLELQAVADARLETITTLQEHLRSSETAAAHFRSAADQRMETIAVLQKQLGEVQASGTALVEALQVAESRNAELSESVARTANEFGALRAEIGEARSLHDALAQANEHLRDDLVAAKFRIEEARQVEASMFGKVAYLLHRLLSR
ncbi:MAG: glycosyltransferase [Betaproteobacteria bacterium]